MAAVKKKKILTKTSKPKEETVKTKPVVEDDSNLLEDIELDEIQEIKEIPQDEYMPEVNIDELAEDDEEIVQPVKRGRGRPKKNLTSETVDEQPKRKSKAG